MQNTHLIILKFMKYARRGDYLTKTNKKLVNLTNFYEMGLAVKAEKNYVVKIIVNTAQKKKYKKYFCFLIREACFSSS